MRDRRTVEERSDRSSDDGAFALGRGTSRTISRDVRAQRHAGYGGTPSAPRPHPEEHRISLEDDNKAIVGRWFDEFWGNPWNPAVIDELASPDIRFEYSLHSACTGRDEVRAFATEFRAAFPDLGFGGTADLIAEGDYVVGQWIGGGTHTGPAFSDLPVGALPDNSGRTMRFSGTSVLRVKEGLIVEEIGLDDGVAVLKQLGLIPQT